MVRWEEIEEEILTAEYLSTDELMAKYGVHGGESSWYKGAQVMLAIINRKAAEGEPR